MEHLLWLIVAPILEFLGYLYDADRRPGARAVTVGCAALVVLAALALGVWALLS